MVFKTRAHVECERALMQVRDRIDRLEKRPTLLDITRNGRFIQFQFSNQIVIETLGMLADDIDLWKEQLGI